MLGPAILLGLLAAAVEPATVVVVPRVFAGDAATIGAADVMVAVERAAARRPTVRVLGALDALPAAAVQRLRDCGPDASCVGAVLRDAAVPTALLVVVNARVSPPVVGVRAVADGVVRGEHIDSRASVEVPLVEAIARAAGQVLDDLGHPEWAELSVEVTPREAQLELDVAEASWRAPAVAWVPPGTVTVRAEAPDHHPASLTVALAAGEARSVALTLEPDQAWWTSGWLWGAVGVGVAAGVVATALALSGGGEPCLCVGHPDAPCECR